MVVKMKKYEAVISILRQASGCKDGQFKMKYFPLIFLEPVLLPFVMVILATDPKECAKDLVDIQVFNHEQAAYQPSRCTAIPKQA